MDGIEKQIFLQATGIRIICMHERLKQRCWLLSNTLKPCASKDQALMDWTNVNLDTLCQRLFWACLIIEL